MISVDALLRLVTVKEELEDPQVVGKIRQILRPKEYTKIDEIIDLVFSTAEDVKKEENLQQGIQSEEGEKKFTPVNFREECITRVQSKLKTILVKRSSALYSSADEKTAVFCLNSREYGSESQPRYWFAFHPHQKETLSKYPNGYVAFGCGGPQRVILIPANDFVPWLKRFHVTNLGDRMYWHVRINCDDNKISLVTKAGETHPDITKFLIK
jgi:hypothetical protein